MSGTVTGSPVSLATLAQMVADILLANNQIIQSVTVNNLGLIASGEVDIPVDTTAYPVRPVSITLGAANTIMSIAVDGDPPSNGFISLLVWVIQDGTGIRTLTMPENSQWNGGFTPSLSTAPGATDLIQFLSKDGGATWIAAIAIQAAAPE